MEKNDIILSVILPCFNHGKYLPEALASVDCSVFRDQIEIIIINDGSTDIHTNEVIDKLDTQKYIVIKQENQGLAHSRNNGILKAKADYVLMLDADNYIEPVFITDFFDFCKKGVEFDGFFGDQKRFGEENYVRKQGPMDFYKILFGNHIDACAIFRRQKLLEVGLYDADIPFMGIEDWDLWLKLNTNNAKIIYKNKVYFNYRVLNNSMIRSINHEHADILINYIQQKHKINPILINKAVDSYCNYYLSFTKVLELLLKKLITKLKLRFN
ncbi:MAG: hypothetical protein CVU09_15230 [Bacteroidetes bacterium HGW-Bacteroidetes-4]|jgi:glycosyltransferase involved in cell wall biosynthesis|nr:MAG: hypothetical protein CVU09_15230 [Bacteroidetes bacterium HGW-Bacteroidetes-4]